MIAPTASGPSDATRRAAYIYEQARSQIDARLWRAALGNGIESTKTTSNFPAASLINVAALVDIGSAGHGTRAAQAAALPATAPSRTTERPEPVRADTSRSSLETTNLGANAGYSSAIANAARRTRIPQAALASIIDAESAKNKAGVWQTSSRNSRSSATGLGQFLSGTWKSEAQRVGTWLNDLARRNGWLGTGGKVRPEMQTALLALRNDADASINATADYARHSLDKLAAAGATIGTGVDDIARAAYLGHNLGLGDAIRFLKGGLDEGRARRLLDAQIGNAGAIRRTAESGGAAAAHRGWLLDFMARHINASRFSG